MYIAALIKTAQQSGNSLGKVDFNPPIFSHVFRRLMHLLMKQQAFKIIFYLPLTYFTAVFLF